MSLVNKQEMQDYFAAEGITAPEFLKRAQKDPTLLDRLRLNFDVFYLDTNFRKSNLDIGVY